jgi:hypothetical protein
MTRPQNKSFIGNLVSSASTATKFISEDFSPTAKKILKLPIFLLFLLLLIFVAPFVYLSKLLKKSAVNPFFMLRTELETKWCKGKQEEALRNLREVKDTIKKDEQRIFFSGVNIPPYGRFKFDEYLKVLWLLYHWEFQTGNFNQASEVCDYFIEQYGTLKSRKVEQYRSKYYSQWVVNKAEIILKQEGSMAAQQYLLRFTDSGDKENPVNLYLYELRNKRKEIV